jgi:hypothetical protein
MKLTKVAAALVVGAFLLTGCWQKSIFPFFKEADVIVEDALLGDWTEQDKEKEKPAKWNFIRAESDRTYRVRIEDGDTRLDLDARLFKLAGQRYFDFYSRARSINEIPAHHLFRVREIGATLKIQIQSPEWTQKWLKEHPNALPTVKSYDPENPKDEDKVEIILAADTDRLQKWVIEHQGDEGFWDDIHELKKDAAK